MEGFLSMRSKYGICAKEIENVNNIGRRISEVIVAISLNPH
jgi:hypothetical protein